MGDTKPSVKLRIIPDQLNKTAAEVAGEHIETRGAEGREAEGYNRIGKRKNSTRKKDVGRGREIKSSNGADTYTMPGDMRGVKEKREDSGGGKRL
eukprot:3905229-Pleurochrysis_carterae.AAC.4